MRRLLVVEDAVEDSRLGLVVVRPALPEEATRAFGVELRRPNGERIPVRAVQMRWPGRPGMHLALLDLRQSDVPIGTEVWTTD